MIAPYAVYGNPFDTIRFFLMEAEAIAYARDVMGMILAHSEEGESYPDHLFDVTVSKAVAAVTEEQGNICLRGVEALYGSPP